MPEVLKRLVMPDSLYKNNMNKFFEQSNRYKATHNNSEMSAGQIKKFAAELEIKDQDRRITRYSFELNHHDKLLTEFTNLFHELKEFKGDHNIERASLVAERQFLDDANTHLQFELNKLNAQGQLSETEKARQTALIERLTAIARAQEADRARIKTALDNLTDAETKKRALWGYCYFASRLLIEFYTKYDDDDDNFDNAKVKLYAGYAKQIAAELSDPIDKIQEPVMPAKKKEPSFAEGLDNFLENLKNDFALLLKTPISVSLMKAKIGFLNMCRVYWIFLRLMVTNGLKRFRDINIIQKFEDLVGSHFDENAFIADIEKPNSIMYGLSVGYFAARFLLNALMALQHICFPPKGVENKTSVLDRMKFEGLKRGATVTNDLTWGLVNLFTNYPWLLNVSEVTGNWVLAGFLYFDLGLILWQLIYGYRDFKRQEMMYEAQIKDYTSLATFDAKKLELQAQLDGIISGSANEAKQRALLQKQLDDLEALNRNYAYLTPEQRTLNCEMEVNKLKELRLNWYAKRAKFLFNAFAAGLFGAAFTVSLIFTAPAVAIVCYALCMVAMALYLSGDKFGLMWNSAKRHNAMQKLPEGVVRTQREEEALAEYRKTQWEFVKKLFINAVIPTLIIAVLAASWQAAIAVVVVLLIVQLYLSYRKSHKKEGVPMLDDGVVEQAYNLPAAPAEINDNVPGSALGNASVGAAADIPGDAAVATRSGVPQGGSGAAGGKAPSASGAQHGAFEESDSSFAFAS